MSQEIKQLLLENPKIKVEYVQAHAGIDGNEKADRAAKRSLISEEINHEELIGISEAKSKIEKWGTNNWKKNIPDGWEPNPEY